MNVNRPVPEMSKKLKIDIVVRKTCLRVCQCATHAAVKALGGVALGVSWASCYSATSVSF